MASSSFNTHGSSTVIIPDVNEVPRHVAIIMDGNGRWATSRHLPRIAGHRRGVKAVRAVVEACARQGVEYLTLFAFSSENWRRPAAEVDFLMRLFVRALNREVVKLHENGIRLKVVGDLSAFSKDLQKLILTAQDLTATNKGLTLTIAANYGGRWDILQAVQKMLVVNPECVTDVTNIDESLLSSQLAMAYAPEPDLFIRTGGESRISNFLIWQLAYTELYFTDVYWPDFDENALSLAFSSYQQRERRFGRTSAQVSIETKP